MKTQTVKTTVLDTDDIEKALAAVRKIFERETKPGAQGIESLTISHGQVAWVVIGVGPDFLDKDLTQSTPVRAKTVALGDGDIKFGPGGWTGFGSEPK